MALTQSLPLPNGGQMPVFGLGTWLAKDEEEVATAVQTAIEIGYRHIDTALSYLNEAAIGKALEKVFQKGVVKREELFIVTKMPANLWKKEDVKKGIQQSLSDLKLDYVDLVLIHSPFYVKGKHLTDFFPIEDGKLVMDPDGDLMDMWQGMEEAVDEGKVRYLGLSNFNSQQIQRIYDNGRIKPVNLQVECHAYLQQKPLVEFCRKLNIAVTAYAPLGAPQLPAFRKSVGQTADDEKPVLIQDPALQQFCTKYNKTPAQILIRWLIQRGIIAIPKSSNPKRLKENSEVFDFNLSEEEMAAISKLDRNLRYFAYDFIPGMAEHPEFPLHIPF